MGWLPGWWEGPEPKAILVPENIDRCVRCGEVVDWDKGEAAEIYRPEWPEDHDSILVHADCMISGDEVA